MKNGLTLIEVILVTALLLISSLMIAPLAGKNLLSANFDSPVETLVVSLIKSQASSMANKDNQLWGICLYQNQVRLFSDNCLAPAISEDFQIPSGLTISGLSSFTFDLRGQPSSSQSITVSRDSQTKQIILNSVGGLDVL